VIRQNISLEDIHDGLVDLGFDVISVKQMSSARLSPEETTSITLPLFLVTFPRTAKSQDFFRLSSLCHISIKVEAYKSQNTLTQCYDCQKISPVWANCKQPSSCFLFGDGHLHRDCPEGANASSTPTCRNCQLAEGEAA
jgi:hypothetical protein